MSEQPRKVKLTRAVEDGGRETFGFSVSGGAGSKLPVIVVWEVTPGLPAALSASVCIFCCCTLTLCHCHSYCFVLNGVSVCI